MSSHFFTPILNPPLGSTSTRASGAPIRFYASIQATAAVVSPEERFTVLLWYSTDGRGAWRPAPFREVLGDENLVLFDLQERITDPTGNVTRRDIFVLDLEYDSSQGPLQFCLKYRFSDGPWLWAGSRIGGSDGRVVFQTPNPLSFRDIFETAETESNWHAEIVGDASGNQIWDVAWKGDCPDTDILELPMGRPQDLEQWMALVKIASPWMGPLHGSASFNITKDALLVLFQRRSDGKHVVILPISGLGFGSAYITSDTSGRGTVVVRGMDDFEKARKVQVVIAVSDNPFTAVSSAVGYLKGLIMGTREDMLVRADDRSMWEDGVSYCTWNGLGCDLSEERIIGALEQLEKAGVKVCNLMIDDNWQSLAGRNYGSSGTWSSFEANEKFPTGLKGLVSNLRARFPYLKHIGVWHALHGYWDGITRDSALGEKYKTVEVTWRDNVNLADKTLTMIAPEDVGRFYDDFYRFLSESGVDCVKTDVQCRIDELKYGRDRAMLTRAYLDAFKQSSIKYFDRRVIYCMAHVPHILYQALLPDDHQKVFFRASDDFYPNVTQSHTWHIFANAMNMVLYSQLHILPDWDMFQSALPTYNTLHAAARCLSGGPIFITDTPGEHDLTLINSMASPFPARTPRALRPERMAVTADPYVAYRSERLLHIRNTYHGASLLGVFNVSSTAVTELVDVSTAFTGTEQTEYIIYAHRSRRIAGPAVREGALLLVGLEPGMWEMFTATPVQIVNSGDRDVKIAALGIAENITGAVAVVGSRICRDDENVVVEVDLCALGLLVVYISGLAEGDVKSVRAGTCRIPLECCRVSVSDSVLYVDVLGAWEGVESQSKPVEDVVTVSICL